MLLLSRSKGIRITHAYGVNMGIDVRFTRYVRYYDEQPMSSQILRERTHQLVELLLNSSDEIILIGLSGKDSKEISSEVLCAAIERGEWPPTAPESVTVDGRTYHLQR